MAKYVVLTIPLTSAVGQQQPVAMLSARRLLRGANQPVIVGFSEIAVLNDCSHRKLSLRQQNQHDGEGRESANSGHSGRDGFCPSH